MSFITKKIVDAIMIAWEKSQDKKCNLLEEYEKLDYLRGKRIIYPFDGFSLGLNSDGSLGMKENKTNEIHKLYYQDIILENEKPLFEILNKKGCNFYINFD